MGHRGPIRLTSRQCLNRESPKTKSEGQDHTDRLIDFGLQDDIQVPQERKVKIKVCGKTIWNHPSNKAMARGGWLHFSIIAKDSNLSDAIKLQLG